MCFVACRAKKAKSSSRSFEVVEQCVEEIFTSFTVNFLPYRRPDLASEDVRKNGGLESIQRTINHQNSQRWKPTNQRQRRSRRSTTPHRTTQCLKITLKCLDPHVQARYAKSSEFSNIVSRKKKYRILRFVTGLRKSRNQRNQRNDQNLVLEIL